MPSMVVLFGAYNIIPGAALQTNCVDPSFLYGTLISARVGQAACLAGSTYIGTVLLPITGYLIQQEVKRNFKVESHSDNAMNC